MATLPRAALRHALTTVMRSGANYFVPYKENYRDAFAQGCGDAPAWQRLDVSALGETVHPTWTIYHPDDPGLRPIRIEDMAANPAAYPRLWVFEDRRPSDAARQAELAVRPLETSHARADEREYFWIRVRLYTLKGNPAKD